MINKLLKILIVLIFLMMCNSFISPVLSQSIIKGPWIQNVRTNAAVIMWETDSNTTSNTVEYGLTTGYGMKVIDNTATNLHEIEITGLSTFTQYHFKIISGSAQSEDGRFTTAPLPGTDMKIVIFGDNRDNPAIFGQICSEILNNEDPVLVVHTGDYVTYGAVYNEWEVDFFTPATELLRNFSFIGCVGNHEVSEDSGSPPSRETNTLYYKFFSLPTHPPNSDPPEAYFSYYWGDIHFIILDINDNSQVGFITGSQQYNWLQNELFNNTSQWVIIIQHSPVLSTSYHGQWTGYQKDHLMPLYENFVANGGRLLEFNGDDHGYQHLYKDGVHYCVTGGAGASLYGFSYNPADYPYVIATNKTYNYTTLDITDNGCNIMIQAKYPDGTIFDTWIVNCTTNTNYGILNHFDIICDASVYSNEPFAVTIIARDEYNNIYTNFNENANISLSNGTVMPASAGPFNKGIWSGSMTVLTTGTNKLIISYSATNRGTKILYIVGDEPPVPGPETPHYYNTINYMDNSGADWSATNIINAEELYGELLAYDAGDSSPPDTAVTNLWVTWDSNFIYIRFNLNHSGGFSAWAFGVYTFLDVTLNSKGADNYDKTWDWILNDFNDTSSITFSGKEKPEFVITAASKWENGFPDFDWKKWNGTDWVTLDYGMSWQGAGIDNDMLECRIAVSALTNASMGAYDPVPNRIKIKTWSHEISGPDDFCPENATWRQFNLDNNFDNIPDRFRVIPVVALFNPANSQIITNVMVNFIWSDEQNEGVNQYYLQVDNDADFSSPEIDDNALIVTNTLIDFSVLGDKVYYWRVSASLDGGLQWGKWSLTNNFVLNAKIPVPPSDFSGTPISTNKILWSWKDNADNETNYIVRDIKGLNISGFLGTNISIWTQTGLLPNKCYTNYAVAFGLQGEIPSNTNFRYTLARVPENLEGFYQNNKIILKWADAGAAKYGIEKKVDNNAWDLIIDWSHNLSAAAYADEQIEPGKKYYYRIKSYNQEGVINNVPGNEIAVSIQESIDYPGIGVYPTYFDLNKIKEVIIYCDGEAEINIYDLAGNRVRSLKTLTDKKYGKWDGKDDKEKVLNGGVYLVHIKRNSMDEKIRMILIR